MLPDVDMERLVRAVNDVTLPPNARVLLAWMIANPSPIVSHEGPVRAILGGVGREVARQAVALLEARGHVERSSHRHGPDHRFVGSVLRLTDGR
jgi:hypothetical protein